MFGGREAHSELMGNIMLRDQMNTSAIMMTQVSDRLKAGSGSLNKPWFDNSQNVRTSITARPGVGGGGRRAHTTAIVGSTHVRASPACRGGQPPSAQPPITRREPIEARQPRPGSSGEGARGSARVRAGAPSARRLI